MAAPHTSVALKAAEMPQVTQQALACKLLIELLSYEIFRFAQSVADTGIDINLLLPYDGMFGSW
jgi:hypothetical protein